MENEKLKKMTVTAILTALNIVISRFLIIPIPLTHGNINLCDAGIFIVALLEGPWAGLFAGAVSGFILDMISGYSQYMFFSLVIHGLEGLVVGILIQKLHHLNKWKALGIMFIGVIIMVSGYFGADSLLYNVGTATIGILMNVIQGIVGMIVAWLVEPLLARLG